VRAHTGICKRHRPVPEVRDRAAERSARAHR